MGWLATTLEGDLHTFDWFNKFKNNLVTLDSFFETLNKPESHARAGVYSHAHPHERARAHAHTHTLFL